LIGGTCQVVGTGTGTGTDIDMIKTIDPDELCRKVAELLEINN